jgi:hypothetical protein
MSPAVKISTTISAIIAVIYNLFFICAADIAATVETHAIVETKMKTVRTLQQQPPRRIPLCRSPLGDNLAAVGAKQPRDPPRFLDPAITARLDNALKRDSRGSVRRINIGGYC